jgi:pimeloyl-ACP methyl ester carboxylesterase
LIAEVLSLRICEQTKQEFRPSWLVDSSSPKQIADLLKEKSAEEESVSLTSCTEEERPPIFVVHGRGGFTLPAPAFIQSLAEGQKLRMFELPGIRGGRCYERIEDMAAVYISQLTEEYPDGPILLAAFCAGGLIAVEMAAQLCEMGRPVHQLVLLDPPIRGGTLGVGRIAAGPKDSFLKVMLLRLLPMSVLRRYHVLKYQWVLRRKRREGSLKYADFCFSTKAQAKLYVSFLRYTPRPYLGPVTILSSNGKSRAYRGGARLQELLPEVRIELISDRHHNIGANASAARAMQAAFDSALT